MPPYLEFNFGQWSVMSGWLARWLVGWLVGWLLGWLVGWLVGWFLRRFLLLKEAAELTYQAQLKWRHQTQWPSPAGRSR